MHFEEDSYYIHRTKNGDLDAFGALVQKHQEYAYTLAIRILKNREEAEEATQDAFLKAFQAIGSFEGHSKFTTWLYSIIYNEALGRIRKNKKFQNFDTFDESPEIYSEQLDAFDQLNSKERKKILRSGLDQLKAAESAVLTLFYLNQMNIKEIEEVTAQSNSQVKILLHRGRKNLYKVLQEQTRNELSQLL